MGDEVEELTETAGRLIPYVGQVSASSNQVIGILCSVTRCQRWDRISKSRHVDLEAQRRDAAEKFAAAGWSFREGPICPDCRSGRRPRGK